MSAEAPKVEAAAPEPPVASKAEETAALTTQPTEPEPESKDEAQVKVEAEAKAEAESGDQAQDNSKETEADKSNNSDGILKTTAQHDQENPSNNVKFDASLLPESNDPEEIRKQVEFYFSDSNISHDKFLWGQTGGAENKPVQISTIHNFKRMRRFKDYGLVVAALRESEVLEVTGESGEELVARKVPYDPTHNKAFSKIVYVKGFGDEEATTQVELEKFFNTFGLKVNAVRLRRTDQKLFKGSVFVEFGSEEEAKKFLALDPKPNWKDHDLKIMSKVDYCEEKNELIRAGVIKASNSKPKFFEGRDGKPGRGRGNSRGGHGSDKRESGDWKDRRGGDQRKGFNNRGGRGRGRGGRGRGGRGGGRGGHRDGQRDRDGPRENQRDAPKPSNGNDVKPTIHSSAPKPAATEANANGKRARDGESSGQEPAAKKVATGSS